MPRPEVLERIKAAEEEADRIISEAESDREDRLAEARERARSIREQADAEAEQLREDRLAAAREELEAEREEILASGQSDREALEAAAASQMDEIVEFTVDLFEEAVHAQA